MKGDTRPKREILTPSSIFVVRHGGYPFDVLVCVGTSPDEIVRALDSLGVTPSKDELSDLAHCGPTTRATTWFLDGHHTVLWMRTFTGTPRHYGHLAHECFHCVDELFQKIGINHSQNSCEAYAYAIEHLVNIIASEMEKAPSERSRVILPEPPKKRARK